MAINKVDFPETVPTNPTDYTKQNENIERAVRGDKTVSLTNWDATTTAPQVAAGSVIESNNVYHDITTNTTISTTGASSGTIYLTFDDTSGSEEFVWSSTAPTWSAELNGWYVSGDKATGHVCVWDGASSFTEKAMFNGNNSASNEILTGASGEMIIKSIVDGSSARTYTTDSTTSSKTVTLARGLHMGRLYFSGAGASDLAYGYIEVNDGASWRIIAQSTWNAVSATATTSPITSDAAFVVFSDGTNYRYRLSVSAGPMTSAIAYVTLS